MGRGELPPGRQPPLIHRDLKAANIVKIKR